MIPILPGLNCFQNQVGLKIWLHCTFPHSCGKLLLLLLEKEKEHRGKVVCKEKTEWPDFLF